MADHKLTLSELTPMVAEYQTAFPDWQLVGRDLLVRFGGPVAQAIWFDRLRTGSYRPTCRVHVLAAPTEEGGTVVLPQLLNIKVREIAPRSHAKSFSTVVAALRSETLPSVDKPLDAHDVSDLLRGRSAGRPANAYALACLLGALGRSEDTELWISGYRNAITGLGLPPTPVDAQREAFLNQVAEWLKRPDCAAQFAEIIAQQKSRLLRS